MQSHLLTNPQFSNGVYAMKLAEINIKDGLKGEKMILLLLLNEIKISQQFFTDFLMILSPFDIQQNIENCKFVINEEFFFGIFLSKKHTK